MTSVSVLPVTGISVGVPQGNVEDQFTFRKIKEQRTASVERNEQSCFGLRLHLDWKYRGKVDSAKKWREGQGKKWQAIDGYRWGRVDWEMRKWRGEWSQQLTRADQWKMKQCWFVILWERKVKNDTEWGVMLDGNNRGKGGVLIQLEKCMGERGKITGWYVDS